MATAVEVPADLMGDRLLKVEEFAATVGISRTAAFAEVQSGRVRSVKIGARRRIPVAAVREYIGKLTGGELVTA